jgi:lysine 6-dehydrogenase
MSYTYAILGAGRQGTAAAYDMAKWGDAARILLCDKKPGLAQQAAERVNKMIGRNVAEPVLLDVLDVESLERILSSADSCLSAVPYYYNLRITEIAIKTKTHLCDLGGNLEIAREQQRLAPAALQAGISIIPNCGQVPGMGTTLMVYAIELLDEATDVLMWDGGLPQHPRPPYNYLLTFHVAGLTNEYAEPGLFLRNGKVTSVEPMTELEIVEFPEPIGKLEAFVTGGGTDTMPFTYEGRLRTLQNKTLRYPGHFAQLRAFYDLGLWRLEPVQVGPVKVVPRDVFHALFEPQVTHPQDRDMVLVRIQAKGTKDGAPAESWVEVIDYYDEATGFSAMERGTGWSAAIVAEMTARGETPKGAGGVETMVPARAFVQGLESRGIHVSSRVVSAQSTTARV